MPLLVNGIIYDEFTSDPSSPTEGQCWFNTTEHRYKMYRNGAVSWFVDWETFASHYTRHVPSGGDPLPTATAVEITDATNAEGTGDNLARASHQHAHGSRGGGSLHSLVSSAGHGFQPQSHRSAVVDPTVTDDTTAGWVVGSRWVNTVSKKEFVCLDPAAGAAVWRETTNQSAVLIPALCMLTNQVGDAVYIRSAMNGNYKVAKCDPFDSNKMPAWGIIIYRIGFTGCVVQTYGEMPGVWTTLLPGKRYFVGGDGKPAAPVDIVAPLPGEKYRVQAVGLALDVGVLFVTPSMDMIIRVG